MCSNISFDVNTLFESNKPSLSQIMLLFQTVSDSQKQIREHLTKLDLGLQQLLAEYLKTSTDSRA